MRATSLSTPFLLIIILVIRLPLLGQKQSDQPADSIHKLQEVVVHAYAADRAQQEVPAAIGVIREYELNRFSNTSFLPAVNKIPGVRMEERSPGSYRFAIRGSSLRSPFGVRNVKFYWNGLPLTDGGGNTYLNIVDFNSVGSFEVIKGPGGSLYGAGTGGVVLLQSPPKDPHELQYSVLGGSFGLFRIQAAGSVVDSRNFQMDMSIGYQRADGYREQTKMDRLMAQINWKSTLGAKSLLSGTVFTTDLYYQTPGGLTKAQFDNDPRQARPATPALPGAVEQQASVTNKTTYAAVNYEYAWNNNWSSRIGMFGSLTEYKNPSIRNYEKRHEENWGGRADTRYKFDHAYGKGKLTFGLEYQHFHSPITVYDNLQGEPGNIQTDDILWSQLWVAFAQVELDLPGKFYLTLGGSGNFINYKYSNIASTPAQDQERNFSPVLSPRIALLKKITSSWSVYGSVSNGFSPPSLAEVRPSTGTFNNNLNAERGVSFEAGLKGNFLRDFEATVAVYDFRLQETIIIQRDASGADYFVNAGATDQKGAELLVGWSPRFSEGHISSLRLWTSYTYNFYRFKDYVTSGKDYSGNALTGVAPNILAGGADIKFKKGFYFKLTVNYTDRIPLNDANTDYASSYVLLGARTGYTWGKKIPLEFFAGIDNALDQRYSLGNDLNATGGRYYNAASSRNYYAGIAARLITRRQD